MQFANYLRGEKGYANNFLILAPNVIVYDRLRTDFESGNVFRTLPFIPKHCIGCGIWSITCAAIRNGHTVRGNLSYEHSAVL